MSWLTDSIRAFFRKGDLLLLLFCIVANLFGIALIFSATRYLGTMSFVFKQILAMCIGIVAYMAMSFVDIELVTEKSWKLLLLFNVVFIALLIPFGNAGTSGNRSWLAIPGIPFNLQPAEIVKIPFIMLMARQMSTLQERGINKLSSIAQIGLHTVFMCGLIFVASKDMGMALVYIFIFIIMAWVGGVKLRWFALGAAAVGGIGFLAWDKLPTYITMRLRVVLDHSLDPLDKGYHQLRSLLAIGSGQLTGQGFLHGTQTQSLAKSALPERHTDFIFAVAGEELGMLGCLLIILILVAIILRCLWVAKGARSGQSALMATGYAGMLMIQVVLNIGMCLFVSPTVGLTLPFFSYGGSSIITTYAAMGIISGIKMRSLPSWLRDRSQL